MTRKAFSGCYSQCEGKAFPCFLSLKAKCRQMMAPSGVHLPELWGNPGASSETAWGVGAAAAQPCTDNILPATPCQELACHSTGIAQGAP